MRIFDAQGREVSSSGLYDCDGVALGDLPGGPAAKRGHGLGAEEFGEEYRGYTLVPDQYIINIELNSEAGQSEADSVPLRPYDFLLERITWACTGDSAISEDDYTVNPVWSMGGSIMGRCTEMEWSDEFTKFMGDRRALVSAVMGDSNGFIKLPRVLRFVGKQVLSIRLNALFYPWPPPTQGTPYPDFRWDFVFHGCDLYPPGKEREKPNA